MLKSSPAQFLTHSLPAALINGGSLWVLYATPLSGAMVNNALLHYFLLGHFLITGYLFTVSVAGVNPAPHRSSFRVPLMVVFIAISSHSILAKYIYAQPPAGAAVASAETGGALMFYGGDLLELALLTIMFSQWYTTSRPKAMVKQGG